MITKKSFGKVDQTEATLYTITDGPYSVSVTDYGATLVSLICPDCQGKPTDIVLGYDDASIYADSDGYLGATVGRFANRIKDGKFTLNNKEYTVAVNNGKNHLHGGIVGFDAKFYSVAETDNSLTFYAVSEDMEEGYPGKLDFSVTYTLKNGELTLDYTAVSDKDTIINLTNHSYFNLNGNGNDKIYNHFLKICADRFCRNDDGNLPTGEMVEVFGTDMDLRKFKLLKDVLNSAYPDIKNTNGIDHNFIYTDKSVNNELHLCAEAKSEKTGITLSCFTTLPGVQLYTANGLEHKNGKGGAVYGKQDAFCLETQNFPDAINKPNFPSPILKAGEKYQTKTVYKMSV